MPAENKLIFETLFKSASEGIVIVDAEGKIVMANPAAHAMFGYSRQLEGKIIEDLLPDKARHAHRKHRSAYKSNPKSRSMGQDLKLFGKRGDGSVFPVEVSLSPGEVEGKPVVIAFIIDITERRNREQIELSMGRLFDQSFNEIYIFDSHTLKFVRLNPAAKNNIGYSMKELAQMTPVDIKPEFSVAEFESIVQPLREGAPKVKFETIHQRKDGTTYPIEVHLQLTTFDMKPAFMAIILDNSERKAAEKKLREYSKELEREVEERTVRLRESQKLYRAIARNFPDGMINVFDRDLRYVFVEGKELYALGISSDMLIGTRYVDRLAPEIAKQTASDLMEVFNGQANSIDIEYRQNDYVLDAVPIPSHDGRIDHILVIERNVTKRKKEQDQVQRALEHERELNILKSRFVSTASHEFRTPLSTILSSASLLSRYQTTQDQAKREKHIERIKNSVQNLTGILNDFLSLDKLETGVVQSQPETFDLMVSIQETCDQLAPTLKKQQHIEYRHQGRAEVFLDKRILTNVLLNLLSNASKYSGEGKAIDLTSRFLDDSLVITVKDQGIGISKEDQKHLFKRFFRSSNAINISGTGLGLNIVKKYVALLDGEIEFYSELGIGSTFIVKLTHPVKS